MAWSRRFFVVVVDIMKEPWNCTQNKFWFLKFLFSLIFLGFSIWSFFNFSLFSPIAFVFSKSFLCFIQFFFYFLSFFRFFSNFSSVFFNFLSVLFKFCSFFSKFSFFFLGFLQFLSFSFTFFEPIDSRNTSILKRPQNIDEISAKCWRNFRKMLSKSII